MNGKTKQNIDRDVPNWLIKTVENYVASKVRDDIYLKYDNDFKRWRSPYDLSERFDAKLPTMFLKRLPKDKSVRDWIIENIEYRSHTDES